jgi:hypothetical protein
MCITPAAMGRSIIACRRAAAADAMMPNSPLAARVLFVAAAAAALVGCASTTGPVAYPSDWPALDGRVDDKGCPDVSGTYANEAAAAFPELQGGAPRLTEVFAAMGRGPRLLNATDPGPPWPVPRDAVSATLQLGPERLSADFKDKDDATSSLVFRRYHFDWSERRYDDLYTCYPVAGSPRLRFFAEPESRTRGIPYLYLEAGGALVFLLKARDGSLVVQWRSDAVGVVLIAPYAKFNSVWWQYPPSGGGR